jgi:hypothetical protein
MMQLNARAFTGFVSAALLLLGAAMPASAGMIIQSSTRQLSTYGDGYCPGCGENGEDLYYTISDGDSSRASGYWNGFATAQGWSATHEGDISPTGASMKGDVD